MRSTMKCPICNYELPQDESFCPQCGFEIHILPACVSKELGEYESRRVEDYKILWKKNQQVLSNFKKQLETLEYEKTKMENEHHSLSNQLDTQFNKVCELKTKLDEVTIAYNAEFSHNTNLKKQISMLESTAKVVEAQRKDLIERLNKTEDDLAKEKNDHKETKSRLKQLEKHSTQQQGQPVAKIIFSSGTHTIQNDVFNGNNKYMIPSSMNSSVCGDAFRIESVNGKVFRLYDICGLTCKINGDKIGTAGMQLYHNDRFSVGHITIQIELPKMNFRDFLK